MGSNAPEAEPETAMLARAYKCILERWRCPVCGQTGYPCPCDLADELPELQNADYRPEKTMKTFQSMDKWKFPLQSDAGVLNVGIDVGLVEIPDELERQLRLKGHIHDYAQKMSVIYKNPPRLSFFDGLYKPETKSTEAPGI